MPDEIQAGIGWEKSIVVDGTKISDSELEIMLVSNLNKNITVKFSPELKDLPMLKFNESLFEALKQRCSSLPKILEETPAGSAYYVYDKGRRCARFYFDRGSYKIDFTFNFSAQDIILMVENVYLSGMDSTTSVKEAGDGMAC